MRDRSTIDAILVEAERAGIDVSLVEQSLRLTPEQRLQRHQSALNLVFELERAGKEHRERSESAAAAPPRS